MNFGDALTVLKSGGRVYRSNWNGRNMWLELQVPDEDSRMTLPYIYIKTVDDHLVPWVVSHSDVMGEDWRASDVWNG
jgi:hypothetical protein